MEENASVTSRKAQFIGILNNLSLLTQNPVQFLKARELIMQCLEDNPENDLEDLRKALQIVINLYSLD